MNTLGGTTQTIFFKGFSDDGLNEEFTTHADVAQGQFVKLHTDGTILPAVAGDASALIIGVAIQTAVSGKNCTVSMRGLGTIIVEGSASMASGPVKLASFTTGTGLNRVSAVADTTVYVAASSIADTVTGHAVATAYTYSDKSFIGWALEASVNAGDQVRMVVKY